MKPTNDVLIEAIRNADTLAELKRLVGPSEREEEMAVKRLKRLDELIEQYGSIDAMPWHVQMTYDYITECQKHYESMYA